MMMVQKSLSGLTFQGYFEKTLQLRSPCDCFQDRLWYYSESPRDLIEKLDTTTEALSYQYYDRVIPLIRASTERKRGGEKPVPKNSLAKCTTHSSPSTAKHFSYSK